MVRKLVAMTAIAAVALLPMTASADQHGKQGSAGKAPAGRSVGGKGSGGKVFSGKVQAGPKVFSGKVGPSRHGYHYSHARHFWHGQWWAYGVGSCWDWDDDYDEYYWDCD